MNIERNLQPNCSESAVTVVDWEKKKIIAAEKMTNEISEEEAIDELNLFIGWYAKKYHVEVNSNGESMTTEISVMAKEIVARDVDTAVDKKKLMNMYYENGTDIKSVREQVEECVHKVDAFAKGAYKKDRKPI